MLPGFRLTLGFTLFYLSVIVLIPLSACFASAASLSWSQFWRDIASRQAIATYELSFGTSFAAAVGEPVFSG